MRQPELGRKIGELRKAKGLTQEELVEKCNISVRTIQRIETGEVSPRVYTVKTILAALEYDLDKITAEEEAFSDSLASWFKQLLLIEIDIEKPSKFLISQLNIAWVFGLIYFLLGFFEGSADYMRISKNAMIYSPAIYVIMKIAVLGSFIYFQRGFILIGGVLKNAMLKITSIILIFTVFATIGVDIASLYIDSLNQEDLSAGMAFTFGIINIVNGVALYNSKGILGRSAKYAGVFQIMAGCFFVTVIGSYVGLIILAPVEILQIIVLFKAIELIKSKEIQEGIV